MPRLKQLCTLLSLRSVSVLGNISFFSAVFLFVFIAVKYNVEDRIRYWWLEESAVDAERQESLWLPDYQAVIQAREIEGIEQNASGITYNKDANTFWVVINSPQLLVELDTSLTPIRTVLLENFVDTEAVAYAGDSRFVIVDERDHTVALAVITSATKSVNRDLLPRITLNGGGNRNKGFEGVAINRKTQQIYVVKEKNPLRLIKLSGLSGLPGQGDAMVVHSSDNIGAPGEFLDDLSGLHFDENLEHLLILSDESKQLAEVDLEGRSVSYLNLKKGFNGLLDDVPQAEGVTLDSEGDLYIVSEPNLIYRFSKTAKPATATNTPLARN